MLFSLQIGNNNESKVFTIESSKMMVSVASISFQIISPSVFSVPVLASFTLKCFTKFICDNNIQTPKNSAITTNPLLIVFICFAN